MPRRDRDNESTTIIEPKSLHHPLGSSAQWRLCIARMSSLYATDNVLVPKALGKKVYGRSPCPPENYRGWRRPGIALAHTNSLPQRQVHSDVRHSQLAWVSTNRLWKTSNTCKNAEFSSSDIRASFNSNI